MCRLFPFPRSLFQNSSGQKNDVFHLDVQNVSGIGQILDFMYTSHLELTPANIQIMLSIAQCLQVPNVLGLCHTFLKAAAAEQPSSGLLGSSVFPPQGALTPDSDCVFGDHYPPLLPACSAEVQPNKAPDNAHPHGSPPGTQHPSPDEVSKQAPSALDGSGPELPFQQPDRCAKLRSFYSKQQRRPAACLGQERATQPPPALDNIAERQSCGASPEHLPSDILNPALELEHPGQHPTKQMRLKKALHLKKLNFLKSQRAAETAVHPSTDDSGGAQHTSPAHDTSVEKVGVPSPRRDEREGLGNPECFGGDQETPQPGELAPRGDQSPGLQEQRQYACELCRKPFKHPSNLELHRRSHTGTLIHSPGILDRGERGPSDTTAIPGAVRSFALAQDTVAHHHGALLPTRVGCS